jgi:hypothetical protein
MSRPVVKELDDSVIQFSVFVENKVGYLLDIINLINAHNIRLLALTCLDAMDYGTLRLVVNDIDRIRILFQDQGLPYFETPLVAVEMDREDDFKKVLKIFLKKKINLLMHYNFLSWPHGKVGMLMTVDKPDMANKALCRTQGIRIMDQNDLMRMFK